MMGQKEESSRRFWKEPSRASGSSFSAREDGSPRGVDDGALGRQWCVWAARGVRTSSRMIARTCTRTTPRALRGARRARADSPICGQRPPAAAGAKSSARAAEVDAAAGVVERRPGTMHAGAAAVHDRWAIALPANFGVLVRSKAVPRTWTTRKTPCEPSSSTGTLMPPRTHPTQVQCGPSPVARAAARERHAGSRTSAPCRSTVR